MLSVHNYLFSKNKYEHIFQYTMDTWSEAGDDKDHITSSGLKRNTAHRSLIQKIEAILASYELQEKYSTKLSTHSLQIVDQIIKTNPEFFRIVESTFIRNVNNNEIETNDVPYIIAIVSHLYTILVSLNIDSRTESTADTCNYILKFLISVIVREQLVRIENETSAVLLILCCDNIIDACIKLIKLKSPAIPKDKFVRESIHDPASGESLSVFPAPVNPKKTTVIENQQSGCC